MKKASEDMPALLSGNSDSDSDDSLKALRHIHPDEVSLHNTAASCWVIVNGFVYDITEFLPDHPGGEEYILQYGGQDVTKAMKDKKVHAHSKPAFDLLDEDFRIGVLDSKIQFNPESISADDYETCSTLLKRRKNFIDVERPMFIQLWYANYTKEFYLEQVHIPRHLNYSAPIFGGILEYITLTPWYVVPIFWAPLWALAFKISLDYGNSVLFTLTMIPVGIYLWTLLEYCIHRFVFHVEALLPDNRISLMLHFLMHGIHHYLPMDRMRLVMPPALSVFLGSLILLFFRIFLPLDLIFPLACGVIPGYVGYDLIHYFLHHGRPFIEHLREMKTYHLDHHYKEANLGFGITSKIWDKVFGTTLYG